MRMLMLFAMFIFATPCFAFVGHFTTGAEIADACYGNMSFVEGYVTGIVDHAAETSTVVEALAKDGMKPEDYKYLEALTVRRWCAPKETRLIDYLAIACKWSKTHLEDRSKVGSIALQRAFADRWPCK